MKKTTHFKLSLLAGAMFVATGLSAVEIKQQNNAIIFDELSAQTYQAKVRLPNGSLQTFKVSNGDFTLSAEMLGLDKLQNGLYKYELTPLFKAGELSKDVRKLNDADISAEYAKTYQSQNQSITGVFTIANDLLADKNLIDPSTLANKGGSVVDQDNPTRDQQILDDLIVDGSACIGQDCVNGESFGFDTLRLKENNLRIKAQDTSATASFPSRDWQITFNDSSNGGANKFSIDDIDGGRTPFTIEADAPSHSLYVDDGGRIGLGTNTPVTEIHIKDGDTPTLRLEQDGSSGFGLQTWDVAGNETNFFVRDATNGSRLPFKIRPGAATNSIYVDTDGDIGLETASPASQLHVAGDGTVLAKGDAAFIQVENTNTVQAGRDILHLINKGNPQLKFENSGNSNSWTLSAGLKFVIKNNAGETVFDIDSAGNIRHSGTLTSNHVF